MVVGFTSTYTISVYHD